MNLKIIVTAEMHWFKNVMLCEIAYSGPDKKKHDIFVIPSC